MTDRPEQPCHAPRDPQQAFISEPITPEKGSFTTELMVQGLAGLPGAFTWRNRRYEILECLEHTKRSSAEGGVPGHEMYLRRQEFKVRLDSGEIAVIYVLRHAPAGATRAAAKKRWFLYSISGTSVAD